MYKRDRFGLVDLWQYKFANSEDKEGLEEYASAMVKVQEDRDVAFRALMCCAIFDDEYFILKYKKGLADGIDELKTVVECPEDFKEEFWEELRLRIRAIEMLSEMSYQEAKETYLREIKVCG